MRVATLLAVLGRLEREMILIIAGGRNYHLTHQDYAQLDQLLDAHDITKVVTGGASGADSCGSSWAYKHDIPVVQYLPDWEAYGAAAGPLRNRNMAQVADALAVFPGGRGTASMITEAKRAGLEIFDFRGEQP